MVRRDAREVTGNTVTIFRGVMTSDTTVIYTCLSSPINKFSSEIRFSVNDIRQACLCWLCISHSLSMRHS